MRIVVIGNGQSIHVVSRSQALAARDVSVRLVTVGPVLPASGIDVRSRPIPGNPFNAVRALFGFLRDVRSYDPDILHLHYAGGMLGALALLTGVRPLAVNVMGGDVLPEQHARGISYLQKRITRRLLERADLLLVKSKRLVAATDAFGDFRRKAHVVRWGVAPTQFHPDARDAERCRLRLGLDGEERIILSPRILRPLYNIRLIVDAFARLATAVPGAVLLVTENHPDERYRRRIQDRVRELGLSKRVRWIGEWPHGEMRGLYSLADVVVMMPSSDGLPQSLFEALACGSPVVMGRLPAYDEIVEDGRSAALVDFNEQALAEALIRLLGDDRLRMKLATAGRTRASEAASLPTEVTRVLDLFHALVRRPRPRNAWAPIGALLDALSAACM